MRKARVCPGVVVPFPWPEAQVDPEGPHGVASGKAIVPEAIVEVAEVRWMESVYPALAPVTPTVAVVVALTGLPETSAGKEIVEVLNVSVML